MAGKVTIQDIANMCQVSKSSVSRYLNGGYVSEENKEKIKDAIEKTGYSENFFAKRLKTKKSFLIGVVIPRIDSVTVGKLLNGINTVFDENGYTSLIQISNLDSKKEVECINSLYQQGVDGIIVDSCGISKKHIEMVGKLDIPVLFTGQKNEYVNYKVIDDYAAGAIMGKYFRMFKHRNVVFLGVSEKDESVGIARKQGFIDAFGEAGKVRFVETDFSFISAYRKGEEVMKSKPSAVICATDNIALGLMRYLHEQQISVPDDVSLAGFGGYDISSVMYPRLTTIAFDYHLLGQKTSSSLLRLINGEEVDLKDEIPLKLIEHDSVKMVEDEHE